MISDDTVRLRYFLSGLERQELLDELNSTKQKLAAEVDRNKFILAEAEKQQACLQKQIDSLDKTSESPVSFIKAYITACRYFYKWV